MHEEQIQDLDEDLDELEDEGTNGYSEHVETLIAYKGSCKQLLSEVDTALKLLQGMKVDTAMVASRTKALHGSCDTLVGDQTSLLQKIEKMEAPLKFFKQLQELGPMLGVVIDPRAGAGGMWLKGG